MINDSLIEGKETLQEQWEKMGARPVSVVTVSRTIASQLTIKANCSRRSKEDER